MIRNIKPFYFAAFSASLLSCGPSGERLVAESYGDEWPLLVDECEVRCVGEYAIIMEVEGEVYAVNRAAKAMGGFKDPKTITKDNPLYPKGLEKMSLSAIEFEGLKLCSK